MLHITLVDGKTLFDDSDRKMKMVVTKTMDGFLVYDAQLISSMKGNISCVYTEYRAQSRRYFSLDGQEKYNYRMYLDSDWSDRENIFPG